MHPKIRFVGTIFLLMSLFIANTSIAQCPDRPGKPVLRDQMAVDSFLAIYPNCTNYIEGHLAIDGKPIYWVYEDVRSYLMALIGLLVVILGALKLIFNKVEFFRE